MNNTSPRKKMGYYPAPGSAGAPRMERIQGDDGVTFFTFPDLTSEEEAAYKKTQIYRNWETMMLHSMKDARVGQAVKRRMAVDTSKENKKRKQHEQEKKDQEEIKKRMDEFEKEKKEWLAKLNAKKKKSKRGRKKVEVLMEEEEESEEEEIYKPYVISPAPSSKATSPPTLPAEFLAFAEQAKVKSEVPGPSSSAKTQK